MNIMVVGGGGREHAIIKKLKEDSRVTRIYALPGNGGIAQDAECVNIGAKDLPAITQFAVEHQIDFAVVAPDDPLVLGAVDMLEAQGIPCFGPRKDAAIIEGSKAFAKELMRKYHIPTARCEIFTDQQAALDYVQSAPLPLVVKADGLALGKGVLICFTRQEAVDAVNAMMGDRVFGDSGAKVVVEEYLEGPEVSVLAFTDGETIIPMVSSMDHKRAQDGDQGLNTGGMGTVAPNPYYTDDVAQRCMREIFLPTIRAMKTEKRTFQGCLYFGLMITADGPKVIEYNCRFGDPETQVVLPLMTTSLLSAMLAVRNGTLASEDVRFSADNACCLILASAGYPAHYEKGKPISIDESKLNGAQVYHAGDALKDGQLVTAGGRVIGITATAPTLHEAITHAYAAGDAVQFEGKYCRSDIGQRALSAVHVE